MSWIDKLENVKFSITTGDGKIYFPLWRTAEKSKEFNVSAYDLINVEGTFVDRKKAKGGKFPFAFYFQGEDNIEQSDEFEKSSNDNRAWTVEHPFYGTIKGQPTNLKRIDSSYNVTEINIEFWESVDEDYPLSEISIKDNIRAKVDDLNMVALAQLVENSNPITADISGLKEQTILSSAKQVPDVNSFNDFKNQVKTAVKTADQLVLDTQTALENVQKVINAPAEFSTAVKAKIDSYVASYEIMKNSIESLFDKYLFESQASSVIAGMCLSSVNPGTKDYVVRADIEYVNDKIVAMYNDYLLTLDEQQVSIYEIDKSWTPDSLIQAKLINLVKATSNGLFLLSFNARQEREYELTEDSNLIVLTHRFLGLDADDKNIDDFRKMNNIKNFELYQIRKGRTIKYFV